MIGSTQNLQLEPHLTASLQKLATSVETFPSVSKSLGFLFTTDFVSEFYYLFFAHKFLDDIYFPLATRRAFSSFIYMGFNLFLLFFFLFLWLFVCVPHDFILWGFVLVSGLTFNLSTAAILNHPHIEAAEATFNCDMRRRAVSSLYRCHCPFSAAFLYMTNQLGAFAHSASLCVCVCVRVLV